MRLHFCLPTVHFEEFPLVSVLADRHPHRAHGGGVARSTCYLHRREQAQPGLAVLSYNSAAAISPCFPAVRLGLLHLHEARGTTGSARSGLVVESLQMARDCLGLEVFRQQVGWIGIRANLDHRKLPIINILLYPEILDIYVSRFAKPLAVDHANGGRGVGADGASDFYAEVPQHAGNAVRLGCAFDQRIQFRFSTG